MHLPRPARYCRGDAHLSCVLAPLLQLRHFFYKSSPRTPTQLVVSRADCRPLIAMLSFDKAESSIAIFAGLDKAATPPSRVQWSCNALA